MGQKGHGHEEYSHPHQVEWRSQSYYSLTECSLAFGEANNKLGAVENIESDKALAWRVPNQIRQTRR